MAINENHPDYPAYSAKFKELWDAYMKLWDEEDAKYPNWQGRVHPAHEVLHSAHRKLSEDIKALQKEYAYLFFDDDDNEEET